MQLIEEKIGFGSAGPVLIMMWSIIIFYRSSAPPGYAVPKPSSTKPSSTKVSVFQRFWTPAATGVMGPWYLEEEG
jgi:hypothetical protein